MELLTALIALPSELSGLGWPQLFAALASAGALLAACVQLRDEACQRQGATQDAIRRSRRALAGGDDGAATCRRRARHCGEPVAPVPRLAVRGTRQ